MSVQLRKGRKGTTIRATGKDAMALFDAMCRSIGEPTLSEQKAKENDDAALAACTPAKSEGR